MIILAAPPPPALPATFCDAACSGYLIATDIPSRIRAVFGEAGWEAVEVGRCESGFNPNAVNRQSGAVGLFQFLPSTWGSTPYADQSPFDPEANIQAAYWLWQWQGWRPWACKP